MAGVFVRIAAVIIITIVSRVSICSSSFGDQLTFFQRCVHDCTEHTCSTPELLREFNGKQPTWLSWMGWSCFEECKYDCQWITVNALLHEGLPIPQFHGKVRCCVVLPLADHNLSCSGHSSECSACKSQHLCSFRCLTCWRSTARGVSTAAASSQYKSPAPRRTIRIS